MKLNDGSIYTAWVKLYLTWNVNSQDYRYLPDKNNTQCLIPLLEKVKILCYFTHQLKLVDIVMIIKRTSF